MTICLHLCTELSDEFTLLVSGEEALALPTPTHSAEVNDESNIDCDQGSSGKEARGQPSDGLPTISV